MFSHQTNIDYSYNNSWSTTSSVLNLSTCLLIVCNFPSLCITVTPCTSNPCQNQGVCQVFGGIYQCFCRQGFSGSNCESKNSFFYDLNIHQMLLILVTDLYQKRFWIIFSKFRGLSQESFCTNTRLVCTYFNAFFIVELIWHSQITSKFWKVEIFRFKTYFSKFRGLSQKPLARPVCTQFVFYPCDTLHIIIFLTVPLTASLNN